MKRIVALLGRGRSRLGLGVRLLVVALGVTAAGVAVVPSPAQAVSCYGDYCSGKDPNATGCGAGAVTVSYRDFSQGNTRGRLELRWSNVCKTNWARVTVYAAGWWLHAAAGDLRAVQDTGYTQSAFVPRPDNTVQVWTPMIYSPVRAVQARYRTDTNPCRTVWTCQWRVLDVRTDYR